MGAVGCVACAGLRCAGDACCNLVRETKFAFLCDRLFILTIIMLNDFSLQSCCSLLCCALVIR